MYFMWRPPSVPDPATLRRSQLEYSRVILSGAATGLRGFRAILISVVVAHPCHALARFLVAALGRKVEQVVGAHHHLHTAPVGGVGVEDLAGVILVEHADAGQFIRLEGLRAVVVGDLVLELFFRRETH